MEQLSLLRRFNQVLLAILLFISLLYIGSGFFIPVSIAGLFAMLLKPACHQLEKWGIHRTVAAFLCVLSFVVGLVLVATILIDQLTSLLYDLPRLDQRLADLLDKAHVFINDTFNISRQRQNEFVQQRIRGWLQYAGAYLTRVLFFAGNMLVDFIIVMTYTLLFLLYRTRLKNFIFKLASTQHHKTHAIINKITDVANSYVAGVFLVVLLLTVVNTAGLIVIGIEHALLFGIMAGILNIIPYLGSLVGSLIPVLFALLTKDSLWTPVVVALFFLAVQQIESYILTPNITGGKIRLNPLSTLMVLLLGGIIWGVAGMIVFVPYLGILKVIFDHINRLKPYGYLLGKEEESIPDARG